MGNIESIEDKELIEFNKSIYKWYKKMDKSILTVVSVPFNTNMIFRKVILENINLNKKILYIWGREEQDNKLLFELRKEIKNITSTYVKEGYGSYDINFASINNIHNLSGKYDLVIIDDISNFSNIDKCRLKGILSSAKLLSKRIILYTIESIIEYGDELEVIPVNRKNPYVEPRVLNTRIDLNYDIPVILYEYIKWFIASKSKIVIFVPDEEKLNLVYRYYTKKLRMKRINIIPLLRSEEESIINNVLRNEDMSTIIITDCLEGRLEDSSIGNAIILFADSDKYGYKRLLYLCCEIGKINERLPEVLLVSKEVSEDMELVKDITRSYNKKKWAKYTD